MQPSTRFNFSPVNSLSLSRLAAGATRRLSPGPRRQRFNGVSSSVAAGAQPRLGLLWNPSVLDHLRAPLTRFHD